MTSERTSAVEKTSSWITTPPGRTVLRSWCHVATLNATRMSTLSDRAMWPSGVTRSWYHVGRPSMLEGKTFFGATGMPMWKMALVKIKLAVWLPEPLTVAAWMVRSLMICWVNLSLFAADKGFYAYAGPSPDCLESRFCEGRHSQGTCSGRAPGGPGSRHGGQADRGVARGERRVRGGRRGVHPRRRLREGGRQGRQGRRGPPGGCRRRAEGPGAVGHRGRPAEERIGADQLPSARHAGRGDQSARKARRDGLQPRACAANLPRAVDGRPFVAGLGRRLQSRLDGGRAPRQVLSDDDDRGRHRRPRAGARHGCRRRRTSGHRHPAPG